ncbi:MAG: DEAD/DEAH box helicase [Acidobacteria bacterium]|nr:DEAD/DEAH box helicase [Acidobacteriota bacterium]MCI0722704.1 DEAD/DEAH box helicase [Acidobacteriota bacterium]
MSFDQLGLTEELARAVERLGFETPTPIQAQAIPSILEGRDVVGTAQTGTGKTAAFTLPLLQRLGQPTGRVRALILTPTRELAQQVESSLREFGRFAKLRSCAIFGGVSQRGQEEALRRGADIVVATPGRLLDLLEQKIISLSSIEVLVLDEADRMMDMGFLPDIRRVVRLLPAERQTLLFSATLPPEIRELTRTLQHDPKMVEVGGSGTPVTGVEQRLFPVPPHLKCDLLLHLLGRETMRPLLVFTRTKHGADRLHRMLEKKRHKVARIHSGRTQGQRQEALEGFKRDQYQILIATDIAARGIDVRNISHVINYDIPNSPDDYIHRIGRTARASATGLAYSFITPEDEDQVRSIERSLRRKLNRIRLKDFAYDAPPQPKAEFQTEHNPMLERRSFRPAASPARVFDRFAHSRTPRCSASGQTPRAGLGQGKLRSFRGDRLEFRGKATSRPEGSIGEPSPEEQAELKRLQRKLFGTGRTRHRHLLS